MKEKTLDGGPHICICLCICNPKAQYLQRAILCWHFIFCNISPRHSFPLTSSLNWPLKFDYRILGSFSISFREPLLLCSSVPHQTMTGLPQFDPFNADKVIPFVDFRKYSRPIHVSPKNLLPFERHGLSTYKYVKIL